MSKFLPNITRYARYVWATPIAGASPPKPPEGLRPYEGLKPFVRSLRSLISLCKGYALGGAFGTVKGMVA